MANTSVCQVHNCCKPVRSRGMCGQHYVQWSRTGDPISKRKLPARQSRASPAQDFFNDIVLQYSSNDCLLWPFATRHGYPALSYNGRPVAAHRLVCEFANGKPNEQKLQAAHSCGNKMCVNGRHLRWATQSENESDKYAHGTMRHGQQHYKARLSNESVRAIRLSLLTSRELSEVYNVSQSIINDLRARRTYKLVP